ncbi:hypothetical protein TNCV_3114331 [Trichonephila clavipes]|nr:hypothetical protein TNCV_3114331 [Trichonephila clavipes]
MPDFIEHADFPSSSPNLNPLDYKLRLVLKGITHVSRFGKRGFDVPTPLLSPTSMRSLASTFYRKKAPENSIHCVGFPLYMWAPNDLNKEECRQ